MNIEDKYQKMFDNLRSNKKNDHISDKDLRIIVEKAEKRAESFMNDVSRISELKSKAENNNLTSEEAEELEIYYENDKINKFVNQDENYSEDGINSNFDLAPEGLGLDSEGESEINWDEN